MIQVGLNDPLGTARAIASLHDELLELNFACRVFSDLADFNALKMRLRGERAQPYHDPEICGLTPDREFWMNLIDPQGSTVALQAFRLDTVDTSLADWAPAYTIGLYMRRQELLIPMHASPPKNSIAERLKGRLAFHGELWIDRGVRNRRVADVFGRLGMLISFVKWHPEAIWALASQQMATHGHLTRMGYSHLERGFFRWKWASDGIDSVEWLAVAERTAIEQMVSEMLTTPQPGSKPAVSAEAVVAREALGRQAPSLPADTEPVLEVGHRPRAAR
jgi:hypothetical protein